MCIINAGISKIGVALVKKKRREGRIYKKGRKKERNEERKKEEKRKLNTLCFMCAMSPLFHTDP